MEWPDDRPPLSTLLGPIGSLLAEVSGVADAKRCIQGSLPDCGWFAAGLVPWGRMARIAHLARFADEAGGVVARVSQEILERRGLSIEDLAAAARVPKKGWPFQRGTLANQARLRCTDGQQALSRGYGQSRQ